MFIIIVYFGLTNTLAYFFRATFRHLNKALPDHTMTTMRKSSLTFKLSSLFCQSVNESVSTKRHCSFILKRYSLFSHSVTALKIWLLVSNCYIIFGLIYANIGVNSVKILRDYVNFCRKIRHKKFYRIGSLLISTSLSGSEFTKLFSL
jgi:hypothetical protein